MSPFARLVERLNALFPKLPRWQEWALGIAAVASVLLTVGMYPALGLWSLALGVMWLRVLWQPMPPPGPRRRSWIQVVVVFALLVAFYFYLCVQLLLLR